MLNNIQSVSYIIPEIILIFALLILLFIDAIWRERARKVIISSSFIFFGVTFISIVFFWKYDFVVEGAFFDSLVIDKLSFSFKIIFILCTAFIVGFTTLSKEVSEKDFGEYIILIIATTLGLFFLASSSDLLMIYLSLEFVSVLSYVLAGFRRHHLKSSEAALKYVIFGGVASGVMLYGMSFLYGIGGSTNIFVIVSRIKQEPALINISVIAILLILAGFGYKIAMVPFHQWCPDVYEGAPTPITAFFSVAPKAGGFVILLRFFILFFFKGETPKEFFDILPYIIGILSIGGMILGNFTALNQNNIKRLLAYSSIAHAGYILMALSTIITFKERNPSYEGFEAIVFYIFLYLFMNLGAFLVVLHINEGIGSEEIEDYRGLGSRSPFCAVALAIFLFSLTGIPPFAGFIGKFYIFYSVIKIGGWFYFLLALIGIINSFLSLFYYARIVKVMFLEKSYDTSVISPKPLTLFLLWLLLIPTLLLGLYWRPLKNITDQSYERMKESIEYKISRQ